jgi:hypothetical protein
MVHINRHVVSSISSMTLLPFFQSVVNWFILLFCCLAISSEDSGDKALAWWAIWLIVIGGIIGLTIIIVTISHWYRKRQAAKAAAIPPRQYGIHEAMREAINDGVPLPPDLSSISHGAGGDGGGGGGRRGGGLDVTPSLTLSDSPVPLIPPRPSSRSFVHDRGRGRDDGIGGVGNSVSGSGDVSRDGDSRTDGGSGGGGGGRGGSRSVSADDDRHFVSLPPSPGESKDEQRAAFMARMGVLPPSTPIGGDGGEVSGGPSWSSSMLNESKRTTPSSPAAEPAATSTATAATTTATTTTTTAPPSSDYITLNIQS